MKNKEFRIRLSKQTAKKLNTYKQHPRETYEDVIKRAVVGLEDKK